MVSGSCSTLAEETWSLVAVVILAVFGFVATVQAVGSVDLHCSGGPVSPSTTPNR